MKFLLKAGAVGPGLAVSTLLWVIVSAGMPASAQIVMFYGGLAAVVLLAVGVAERRAVQVLFAARPLREPELVVMAPVLTGLCRLGLGPPLTSVLVARRPGAPAAIGRGRRSVVAAGEFVDGLLTGQLPKSEAVAVLAHAAVVAHTGLSRHDLAIALWSTPWRLLRTIARPMGGLLGIAWKVRIIVFVVAIWQCLAAGPPVAGSCAAVVLTLVLTATYTTRWCADRWERHVELVGDRELVAMRLGKAMAEFLHRYPATRTLVVRQQTLDPHPEQVPLRLVGA